MTVFGVHAGLQNTSMASLRALWKQVEQLGFGWISVWDHFYSATLTDGAECHEAVATHAALACDTSRVRCGSLVYSVGYRHPAVLANAIATIDHLSGGRAELGLGAGWSEIEYRAYGIPFPPVKVRMDQLEEAIQCVRGLLREETTDFKGEWFEMRDARCEPKPLQAELPIWIGGSGEKRTLRIAAQWADAWNVPFVDPGDLRAQAISAPPALRHRRSRPAQLRTAVNVGTRVDGGEPAVAVRWPGRLRAPGCAVGQRRRGDSIASVSTSMPAPIRSTSRSERRSTPRLSNAWRPHSGFADRHR